MKKIDYKNQYGELKQYVLKKSNIILRDGDTIVRAVIRALDRYREVKLCNHKDCNKPAYKIYFVCEEHLGMNGFNKKQTEE